MVKNVKPENFEFVECPYWINDGTKAGDGTLAGHCNYQGSRCYPIGCDIPEKTSGKKQKCPGVVFTDCATCPVSFCRYNTNDASYPQKVKSLEELKKMSPEEISSYFHDNAITYTNIFLLLQEASIPTRKMSRNQLIKFASNSISGNGLFERIAKHNLPAGGGSTPTFKEIEKEILEKGGKLAEELKAMDNKVAEITMETCDVCGRLRGEDSRGLLTIPDDKRIWKVHYNCVITLIKKYLDNIE